LSPRWGDQGSQTVEHFSDPIRHRSASYGGLDGENGGETVRRWAFHFSIVSPGRTAKREGATLASDRVIFRWEGPLPICSTSGIAPLRSTVIVFCDAAGQIHGVMSRIADLMQPTKDFHRASWTGSAG